jgi:DNA-binding FrmR family transcriptional regulator
VGTFLSVFSLSFAVFQYWRKKQDEKMELFRTSIEKMVQNESTCRKDAISQIQGRVKSLEETMSQRFENRLSVMEGELKGIRTSLQSISNWFINNSGGK